MIKHKTETRIRNATINDARRLLEIYAFYVINTAISFECVVPTEDEFEDRITNTIRKYPYLVIEENGEIKGYAYAGALKKRTAYDHSCEVSIYLDTESRGKGYGRALYEALEEALQDDEITNLYACIANPIMEDEYLTKNSEKFHENLGYIKVGEFHKCGYKFGRWYNVIWMEKIISEHS